MNRTPRVCFAIVVLVLSAAVARADVVTDWNVIALQTIGITAIQEAATDGNPRTDADPTWLPQIATPPYPDHTSGANNVTGATTRALELLFGDKYNFVVTSLIPGTTPIQYHRFSEMADDVVDVRVYKGIHSAERT